MAGERWIFSRSQLANTPSRKAGQSSDKELNWRQQAANLIQDMGQKLQVTQLCINTAIVFMHRFYMVQSFTKFHRNHMATACLFLAAKVEEQPRKLEHVLKASHACLRREEPLDVKSNLYLELAQELVVNENILLQTLGFETTVDHPHTHVVRTCTLVRASKDLAQTSYFLATNSLHLTTMCLEHKPEVVAAVCIHLACKWASWEIPKSSEGKEWYWYTDTTHTITLEVLEALTQDFLAILDKCPSKLRKKLMNTKNLDEGLFAHLSQTGAPSKASTTPGTRPQQKPGVRRPPAPSTITSASAAMISPPPASRQPHRDSPGVSRPPPGHGPPPAEVTPTPGKPTPATATASATATATPAGASKSESTLRRVRTEPVLTPHEYFERKEREKLERERIEKERRKIAAEKEASRAAAAAKQKEEQQRASQREKHRLDAQHRQHTNIFDEMREVRKPGEVPPHHRKPGEHGVKERPQTRHGEHTRTHSEQLQQRRSVDRPPHHREGASARQPQPQTQPKPTSQPKSEPPVRPAGGPPGHRAPPVPQQRPLPLPDTKLPLGPVGKLPPLPPLDLDLGSSPGSDDGAFTSQVAELIQRSLEDEAHVDTGKTSPLISVDDVDVPAPDPVPDLKKPGLVIKRPSTDTKPTVAPSLETKRIKEEVTSPTSAGTVAPAAPLARIKEEQIPIKTEPGASVKPESQPLTPESERQGSLKIKLDLKGASSSRKHERHHERSERHRRHHDREDKHDKQDKHHRHGHGHRKKHRHHEHREHKIKIKPPVPPEGEEVPEGEGAQPREKLILTVNLKNRTTSSPIAGSSSQAGGSGTPAELEPGEIQDDDEDDGAKGEYQMNQSPNPMKLVLSKSRAGHYSSREHKHEKHRHSSSSSRHHRHSSSERSEHGSRSRKRAHSPAESARHQSTSNPLKMPRADQLRSATTNHEGTSNGGKSGSPAVGQRQGLPSTPSHSDLTQLGTMLKQVIDMKQAELTQTSIGTETGSPLPTTSTQ